MIRSGVYCNVHVVGEPIAYEAVGMPLSSVGSMSRDLSQAFAEQVEKGAWVKSKDKHRPNSTCTTVGVGQGPQSNPIAYEAEDILAAFIVFFIFASGGISLTALPVLVAQHREMRGSATSADDVDQEAASKPKSLLV